MDCNVGAGSLHAVWKNHAVEESWNGVVLTVLDVPYESVGDGYWIIQEGRATALLGDAI